jgi:Fe-S-cluster-containing dehydrogenase component
MALESKDVLIQMQDDLQRALAKAPEERRWGMAIDLRRCVGCHACTIACVAENKLPPGVVYRPVIDQEIGTYPNVRRLFTPRPCMQCENPPCVPVCPVKATYKNAEGVTVMDYKRCIGCRYCLNACPYSARTADFGHNYITRRMPKEEGGVMVGRDTAKSYEQSANYEYGTAWKRTGGFGSPVGNARKCHFCLHRVHKGELPACTTSCISRATYFGDLKDPESLITQLVHQPNARRYREELGTKPNVYYLV